LRPNTITAFIFYAIAFVVIASSDWLFNLIGFAMDDFVRPIALVFVSVVLMVMVGALASKLINLVGYLVIVAAVFVSIFLRLGYLNNCSDCLRLYSFGRASGYGAYDIHWGLLARFNVWGVLGGVVVPIALCATAAFVAAGKGINFSSKINKEQLNIILSSLVILASVLVSIFIRLDYIRNYKDCLMLYYFEGAAGYGSYDTQWGLLARVNPWGVWGGIIPIALCATAAFIAASRLGGGQRVASTG
jgi:hypothetical protein